jgi:hypothetical protein
MLNFFAYVRNERKNMGGRYSVQAVLKGSLVAIFIINLGLLSCYVFFGYQPYFHSDSAAKVLLAREIYNSGEFFPRDWNYVNNDLLIIFGHLAIIPLLNVLPAGYTVHSLSGLVSASIILCGIWFLLKSAQVFTLRILSVLTVFSAGISGFFAENLFGQVSYGPVFLICCVVLFLTNRVLTARDTSNIGWTIVLSIVIFLAFWSNPKRALINYELPFIASLTWIFLIESGITRKKYLNLVLMSLVGVVAGSLAHICTLTETINVPGAADARWLSIDQVPRNIILTVKGIYGQLGGILFADSELFSVMGLSAALRFILATAILIMMPLSIRSAVRLENMAMKNIALFGAFSFSLMIFFQILTTIPDQTNPVQSSRYLLPSVALCLIVLLTSPINWSKRPLWSAIIIFIIVVFSSTGFSNFNRSGLSSEPFQVAPKQLSLEREALLNILSENDLHYGYASYWNAGVLSVLSDEKVRVRQIFFDRGLPMPMRHLSSNAWYRPSAWKGPTFILLHSSEKSYVDFERLSELGLAPVREINLDDFSIYVFDVNISKYIPGWHSAIEEPLRFIPSEQSPSAVGEFFASDQGSRSVLVAEKGQSGALYYGPYIDVDRGNYRATFDVTAPYDADGVVRLDVSSSPDQNILGELNLSYSNGLQVIEFSLSRRSTLEFRVWALGKQRVSFFGVTIERIPK